MAPLDPINFTIIPDDRGLYYIHKMNVGPKPKISDEKFTSKVAAQKALKDYIEKNNKE